MTLKTVLNPIATSSSSSSSLLHTSAILSGSWGGGKLKTHSGTAKRFKPVGKRRSTRVYDRATFVESEPGSGFEVGYVNQKVIGCMYKRGRSGKQHLNSKMHHGQEARLRGTKVEQSGHTIRTLNRLIGSHY